MALNTREMRSNMTQKAFFSKKLQNRPAAKGFAPRPPYPLVAGGSAPRPPSVIRFSILAYSHMSPKLDLHIPIITFRPFPLPKSWLSANGLQLQIFHSTTFLPHKKLFFFENY